MQKVLFIHHSTGANLIKEGKLREEIGKRDVALEFWDHSYNLYPIFSLFLTSFTYHSGLTDNKGKITGRDYNIVLSNNSPREYADIFSRNPSDPTLSAIFGYDVIAFKNCYPTSQIKSDQQLDADRKYYESIRESVKKYPQKQFILLTPPPERKEMSNLVNAQRAKKLVSWLYSPEFITVISNLHVFDLFSYLSDSGGFLRKEYTRLLPVDSHPNKKANQMVAPIFAEYLVNMAN